MNGLRLDIVALLPIRPEPDTSRFVIDILANSESIEALLHKLEAKLSIGELLDMKAKAQNLTSVENADEADEAYTYEWALNPAEVTKLLNGTYLNKYEKKVSEESFFQKLL